MRCHTLLLCLTLVSSCASLMVQPDAAGRTDAVPVAHDRRGNGYLYVSPQGSESVFGVATQTRSHDLVASDVAGVDFVDLASNEPLHNSNTRTVRRRAERTTAPSVRSTHAAALTRACGRVLCSARARLRLARRVR